MKINEVIINPAQSIYERLADKSNNLVANYEKFYKDTQSLTQNFTIPPKFIYPRDTIYEIISEIKSAEKSLSDMRTSLPQLSKLLSKLLDYYDQQY
jgi:hypothetical protein